MLARCQKWKVQHNGYVVIRTVAIAGFESELDVHASDACSRDLELSVLNRRIIGSLDRHTLIRSIALIA